MYYTKFSRLTFISITMKLYLLFFQNVSKNGLGTIAAKYLSIALMQSQFLQQLNLSGNNIDSSINVFFHIYKLFASVE